VKLKEAGGTKRVRSSVIKGGELCEMVSFESPGSFCI